MKFRINFILFVLFFSLLPSLSYAVSFNNMNKWASNEAYGRGDVVALGYDIYVATLPSREKRPDRYKLLWRKVKYNDHAAFVPKKIYFLGRVVSHDGKYYVSLGINVPPSEESLSNPSWWLEFTHPGLTYDLPDYDNTNGDIGTLIGVDSNQNEIRDDYETTIIFSDLPDEVKESALNAGKAYGQLIQSGTNNFDLNESSANNILVKLVLAEQCKREMKRLNSGATWKEASFFNTIDRLEAKVKLENMLAELIETEELEVPQENSCYLLSTY